MPYHEKYIMTQYSILQAIISPRTDERINIGIVMSDGRQTSWKASEQKLNILRLWRGEAAYRMVKRISDGLETNEQLRQEIMQPAQLSYIGRYANNLVAMTPASNHDANLTTSLASTLYHNTID